jgi:hypothetical protein
MRHPNGYRYEPGSKMRNYVDSVWAYLQEMLAYQRTLPKKEGTELVGIRVGKMADELALRNYDASAAISILEGFGYLMREGYDPVMKHYVYRLRVLKPFDPDNPPQEWVSKPPRFYKTSKKMEKAVITKIDIERKQPVVSEKTLPGKVVNGNRAAREILIAGLRGLLEDLDSEKDNGGDFEALQRKYENTDADLTIVRAENNELKKRVKDLERENREIVDMADEACKGIRTAKGLVQEVLSRLAILDPEVWQSLPGSAAGIAEAGLGMIGWQTVRDYEFVISKLTKLSELREV